MSRTSLTVFRGIYAFVIALLVAFPLSKIVFFTTKPLAFLDDWQIIAFAGECAGAFLLVMGAAKKDQKRRVTFAGGGFITAAIVVAVGFCFWHHRYLGLPRVGLFDLLPVAFLLIPASAIFAALYARRAERKKA